MLPIQIGSYFNLLYDFLSILLFSHLSFPNHHYNIKTAPDNFLLSSAHNLKKRFYAGCQPRHPSECLKCRRYHWVPGADSPYLPGVGVIPFRVSNSPSNYPARAQYSFYVPLHETFWFNYIICDTLRNINSFWQNRLAVFYCTPLLTTVYDFQALRTDQSKIIFSVPSGFKNTVFEIPLHSSVTFCSWEEQRRTLCILPSLHSKSTVMSPCAFIPRAFPSFHSSGSAGSNRIYPFLLWISISATAAAKPKFPSIWNGGCAHSMLG